MRNNAASHKIKCTLTFCAAAVSLFSGPVVARAGATVGTAGMPSAAQSKVPIGVNLEGPADWRSAPMFVDAMKTARAFGTAGKPWEKTASVDGGGNPTGDAGVVVFTGQKHAGGTYHFSYRGRVTVGVTASHASVTSQRFDAATGRTSADVVVADDADQLMLTLTGTSGGVRDLRLIRPGSPADTRQVFTTQFLAVLRPFSTLRLMDYLQDQRQPRCAVERAGTGRRCDVHPWQGRAVGRRDPARQCHR